MKAKSAVTLATVVLLAACAAKEPVKETTAGTAPIASAPKAETPAPAAADYSKFIVCIDPGHQMHGDLSQEPVGPGATETKYKVAGGTRGKLSGPEPTVTLDVGLRLRDVLAKKGVRVVMTRTEADVNVANSERAAIANRAEADLCIRLHCDAGRQSGCFTLYPDCIPNWTDDICEESLRAAKIVQPIYASHTGIPDNGVRPRKDLSGFNWSDVPTILTEMLNQPNPEDDAHAADPEFRQKMAEGLGKGVLAYLDTVKK